MIYKIEIKEEAKQDIISAAKWYSKKAAGLDHKFIAQLEFTLKIIQINPKTFKKVYKAFRQAALKKFPYVVLYEYNSDSVIIFSVFHTSMNPIKKLRRLRN